MPYTYNPTSTYIDPTGNGNPQFVEEPQIAQETIEGFRHINPTSTQIDIESVAYQLSNDPFNPEMTVTAEQLKTHNPYIPTKQ